MDLDRCIFGTNLSLALVLVLGHLEFEMGAPEATMTLSSRSRNR